MADAEQQVGTAVMGSARLKTEDLAFAWGFLVAVWSGDSLIDERSVGRLYGRCGPIPVEGSCHLDPSPLEGELKGHLLQEPVCDDGTTIPVVDPELIRVPVDVHDLGVEQEPQRPLHIVGDVMVGRVKACVATRPGEVRPEHV